MGRGAQAPGLARTDGRGNGRQRSAVGSSDACVLGPGSASANRGVAQPAASTVMAPETIALVQGTLADEIHARDYYLAAADRFADRRFANLARAEQRHVDALSRLVRMAGAEPTASASGSVQLPEDVASVEVTAQQIERSMIAAYDVLLAVDTIPSVRTTFERIQAANRRHLAAAGGQAPPLPPSAVPLRTGR